MRILSIGLDKRVLNESSATFKRFKEYARLVDELRVIVFGPEKEIKNGNLFICGSGGRNKIFRFLRAYKKAKDILKNENLGDWLITAQDPFFSGFLGYLLKRKFKVGLNIQEHGDFFSKKYWRNESLLNFLRYYLGKFLIKRADSIRAVSQRIKNTLSRMGIDKNKIIVVPIYTSIKRNHILNIDLRNKYEGKFVFLTMARLVKQKNLPLLIKVFREVSRKFNQAILLIVGRGPEKKKLVNLVRKLNLEDKIEFIDWTDDVYSYYSLADVYVLSSNYEGWGLVVVEAASFGLPIIMTDVGCAGEVIRDGQSGIVIPIDSQRALEQAMAKIIGDNELRKKLGKNAKKAISALPDKEETLKLYKKSWETALRK